MTIYFRNVIQGLKTRLLRFLLNRLEDRRACSMLPDSSKIVDAAVYLKEALR